MEADLSTLTLEGRPPLSFKPVAFDRKNVGLITFEEHAVTPFTVPTTSITFDSFKPEFLQGLKQRLSDVELRVQIMDTNNITAQIISLNQPTAQAFVRLEECIDFCHKANEYIYQNYCAKYPKKFFAFATLPTQDGKAAAAELERCVKEYSFVGAMINGYTVTEDPNLGLYLDDKQYDALWAVSERLQKPIFIHPRVPRQANLKALEDMPIFHGAPYGFGRETVEHLLRIMYTGVFDRFPKLKICLGHCGEGLSWILPRTDTTFRMYTKGMLTFILDCS
jgi:predicted TIM-barrel fold metal-dependent hydrolase